MKLKQGLLILSSALLVMLSANSHAGRQGVNAYYGLGAGVLSTSGFDVSATGTITFGLEEDGWAVEAVGIRSMEAGTDDPQTDYSIQGVDIGLGYRTIEKNHRYYIFKYSKTDVDITLKETIANVTTSDTLASNGKSYSFGMGFRMSRENKLEVSYTYHSNEDIDDPIHFVNVSYLWGGAPYQGGDF